MSVVVAARAGVIVGEVLSSIRAHAASMVAAARIVSTRFMEPPLFRSRAARWVADDHGTNATK
jgi:hypothetical protein